MALAVVAGVAAFASTAGAEDVEAIAKRGAELRRQGRDREALVEFQRAMNIRKTPRLQAQVALAEQALGMWNVAEEDLLAALAQGADPWISKNRAALNKALDTIKANLGTLDVWGSPTGAEVFVNEKPVGTLPLKNPVRVFGESAVVRVRAKGYFEATRTPRIVTGQTVREYVELVAVVAAPAAEPLVATAQARPDLREPRPMTTTSAPPGDGAPSEDQLSEARSTSHRARPLAWIAAVGAVGGLTLGVVETFASLNNKHAFDDHTMPNPADPAHPIFDCNTDDLSEVCRPLQQSFNRSVTLAIVGYAVGGALAIGSAVLFVVSSRADKPSHSALACVPDVKNPGLACQLVF